MTLLVFLFAVIIHPLAAGTLRGGACPSVTNVHTPMAHGPETGIKLIIYCPAGNTTNVFDRERQSDLLVLRYQH